MRRLFAARGTTAAATGIVVALAAGGGYAIAAGGGTIKACSQKHGHILYTGKCHKGDKKLSWNKVGPTGARGATGAIGATGATGAQGPGATKIAYDATGTTSSPGTPLPNMGPYSLSGQCLSDGAGKTTTNIFISGPSGTLDGLQIIESGGPPGSPSAASGSFPTLNNVPLDGGVTSTSSSSSAVANKAVSSHVVFLPSSGSSFEALITIGATGGTTAPSGGIANQCHASIAVTPLS